MRQGDILSPHLFAVYVDDYTGQLIDNRSGCFIERLCSYHVMYADDVCLLACSVLRLQKLSDYYYYFIISWTETIVLYLS